MANVDFPRGFIPVSKRDGGQLVEEYWDVAPTAGEIAENDLLERRTDGYVWPAQALSTTLVGVSGQHVAANPGAGVRIPVYPLENLLMVAQASGDEIDAQTDFDLSYDILATAPVNGKSQMEINSAVSGSSATLPIKIIKIVDLVPSTLNALGANVALYCVANNGVTKGAGIAG